MKEYIILKIIDNTLVFDYKTISKEEHVFLNKNSFNSDTLYYDLKYYKKNIDKIINTIRNKGLNIVYLKINRLVTFKYTIYLINGLNIVGLTLNFLSTIDVEDYNLFLECKTLKAISCYFMSSDIINKFKEKGIVVNTSSTKTITDKFMEMQKVDNKDKFYYSKVVNIKEDYPELLDDLEEFLKINYKLKAINIYVYSKELVSKIIDLVRRDESKNVIVYLHQETDKGNFIVNNFSWLKELSDKCKDEYSCEFRIIYSESFVSKNLFKQLTFNNLKLISILCVYVGFVFLMIYASYEYIEKISVDKLNASLREVDSEEDEEESTTEVILDYETDNEETSNDVKVEKVESNKYKFENSMKKLKSINNETVGYIVIPNTNISYPVVKHSDNGYYLTKDFYQKKSTIGWIYMDYRNDEKEFGDNTIIYGHNMSNGTMFGSLKKVLEQSFRKDEDNMIVSIDTETGSYKFKIFSAYKVDYTTDYLITNFDTKKEKEDFIKMISNRSSIKSKVKVTSEDKILTLSTCSGNTNNNRRLVVHAVLMVE